MDKVNSHDAKSLGVIITVAVMIIFIALLETWRDNTRVRSRLDPATECVRFGGHWYDNIKQCSGD